jgi:hypothetical protein
VRASPSFDQGGDWVDRVGWMLLYGLLYLAVILLAGMAAFRRREF